MAGQRCSKFISSVTKSVAVMLCFVGCICVCLESIFSVTIAHCSTHNLSLSAFSVSSEAVRGGHIHVAEYLIKKGLDINFRTHNDTGGSPLWWAKKIHGNDAEMVFYLESKGAKLIAPDEDK